QLPVIAAGGIMDGAGIAAAQALGAQAVQMGTAFLVCPESAINTAYRAALAAAQATDTVTTRTISGRPARGIRNAMIDALEAEEAAIPPYPVQNALTGALRKLAGAAGDAQYLSLWAGQGVAQARALPAAQLLQQLKAEWQAAGAQ
ncbi:nitronate monooxygenase family protein, partial [Comamonas sp. B-9]